MYTGKRQEKAAVLAAALWLLNMAVVVDMILAIAVIAITPGTVSEFQIRVGDVRAAADGAAVGIGSLGLGSGCLIGSGIKGNGLATGMGGCIFGPAGGPAGIDPPGLGQHIQYIAAKKQEIVGQGDDAEEIIGEGGGDKAECDHDQIDQGKDPCLHGNDKKQQEMGIGVHGCIAQEETQVQICHICLSAKNQTPDIHQYHTGQIEQIELKGAPGVFHGPAQRPVAEQGNGNQKQIGISGAVDQGEGNEPPDLTMQDGFLVEAQQRIQGIISGHLANEVYHSSTGGNIEHQVGDALVTVDVAEALKAAAQVFQGKFTPKKWFCLF